MSRSATRQAIATALDTLTYIHGHAERPSVMSEGDSWPQWAGSTYAGGRVHGNKWNVLLILPQTDDTSADHYADEHAEEIIDALRTVLFVDETQPAKIPTEAGDLYALLFSGRSE